MITLPEMNAEPATLTRSGAWGQLGVIALTVGFWLGGISAGVLASCVGYFVVTTVGIVGMSRAESGIAATVMYPFLLPGLIPLYYFASR